MKCRLDVELVKRGFFRTRNKAHEAIINGYVSCNGKTIKKPNFSIDDTIQIEVDNTSKKYVSRGGFKLEKAIDYFSISLTNKIMIDIGSSTGGFSDCALQHNIKKIYAVDVGTNQFDFTLKNNNKVSLFENTDFRIINNSIIEDACIATIDVSFISVKKLISKLSQLENLQEIVCLIKPQFECGKEIADLYKGIILDKKIHQSIIQQIILSFESINFYCDGVTHSPICGGSGNIEYLGYFKKGNKIINLDFNYIVDDAFYSLKHN